MESENKKNKKTQLKPVFQEMSNKKTPYIQGKKKIDKEKHKIATLFAVTHYRRCRHRIQYCSV